MHLSQILGFILLNLLIISRVANTANSNEPNEYGDYDEDDEESTYKDEDQQYLDSSSSKSLPGSQSQSQSQSHIHYREVELTSSTPPLISTSIKDTNAIHGNNDNQINKQTLANGVLCPTECHCIQNSHLLLNCSNKQLTSVPKDIPKDVYYIDLSNNLITSLDAKTFYKLPQLYKIDLFNNSIETVHKEALQELPALREINLTRNELTQLDPRVFSGVASLHKLYLSENPIKIPNNGSFLNISSLILLDLSSCNLSNSDLQEDMFMNLQHLTTLDLHDNEIEGDINTILFKPLEELLNLRMPAISRDSLKELCDRLPAIDLIHIEHEYSVSCFILSTLPFEESIVPQQASSPEVDDKGKLDNDLNSNDINEDIENEAYLNSNELPYKDQAAQSESESNKIDETQQQKEETHKKLEVKLDENESSTENTVDNGSDTPNNGTKREELGFDLASIPDEVIKYMLIALFGIAVVGILIGLLCRRDVGGIKTKMCRRSKKTKNKTNGQTQPLPEEVPLNKITTSSS